MLAPLTLKEHRVYEFYCRFRRQYGVSPTFQQVGVLVEEGRSTSHVAIRETVHSLVRKGWMRKLSGLKHRQWIPTPEAKMMERLGEMWELVKEMSERDVRAKEIVEYVGS